MTNVKAKIQGNEYTAVCPVCNTLNVITHVPQKIFVLQLNKVCVHYKDLRQNENAMRFEAVK